MNGNTPYIYLVSGDNVARSSSNNNYTDIVSMGEKISSNTNRHTRNLIIDETAAGRGDMDMDESTKLMLERMDRDIRDHKQEMRDRDARLQSEMQEREKRIREESAAREERMIAIVNELKSDFTTKFDKLESKFDKFDSKFETLESNVDNKLLSIETKVDNTYKHISSITITTIAAIGACVIAVGAVVITVLMK